MMAVRGVTAIVLTHRRPRLASAVVRQLMAIEGFDPSQVLLVVNGEGGLDDDMLERSIMMLRLDDNCGPAGGFRAGLSHAYATTDSDWFYLCEDDAGLLELPSPRVSRVVRDVQALDIDGCASRVGAVLAFARDLDRRSGISTRHVPAKASGLEDVDVAAWGCSLVSRQVIEEGLLPDEQWFFGYEDFDYWLTLRRAGYRLLLDCASAVAASETTSQAGRELAFSGQRPTDSQEPWRAYYVARNFMELSRRHGHLGWHAAHMVKSLRRLQRGSAAERRAILWGLADGARGRLGRNEAFVRVTGEL